MGVFRFRDAEYAKYWAERKKRREESAKKGQERIAEFDKKNAEWLANKDAERKKRQEADKAASDERAKKDAEARQKLIESYKRMGLDENGNPIKLSPEEIAKKKAEKAAKAAAAKEAMRKKYFGGKRTR